MGTHVCAVIAGANSDCRLCGLLWCFDRIISLLSFIIPTRTTPYGAESEKYTTCSVDLYAVLLLLTYLDIFQKEADEFLFPGRRYGPPAAADRTPVIRGCHVVHHRRRHFCARMDDSGAQASRRRRLDLACLLLAYDPGRDAHRADVHAGFADRAPAP